MLGLCWIHKTAWASLAFLSLCLPISLFSPVLFNSLFFCLGLFLFYISWLIHIHFSSPKSEKAFPETAILSCHWQQILFVPRISVPPFVSFPIFFFMCQGLFCFASFLSCLVSHSYIFLSSKLSFYHLFSHWYFPASDTYIPFLP